MIMNMTCVVVKQENLDHMSYGRSEEKMNQTCSDKIALLTGIKHEHDVTEPCYHSIEQLFACRRDRYIFCESFQNSSQSENWFSGQHRQYSGYRRFGELTHRKLYENKHLINMEVDRSITETFIDADSPPEVPIDNTPSAPATRKRRGTGRRSSKTGGSSPYTTVPLPPCKVCSGVATGYHFGVITCEACKAFFRRALIHKHNYKCLKDDNCVITDKKLGNCSACRLRKCFELGMSKGGVRRGRYSIAIRTQAILEAKAREADVNSSAPAQKKRRLDDTLVQEIDEDGLDGLTFDVFDGLLDISDLTGEEYTLASSDESMTYMDTSPVAYSPEENVAVVPTVYVEQQSPGSVYEGNGQTFYQLKTEGWGKGIKSEPSSPTSSVTSSKSDAGVPVYKENRQLEFLIDAVMSCQDAVYPNLKKQHADSLHEDQYKIFEALRMKEEMFGGLFGTEESSLSTAEFQQIFAETGLDLDDRLGCFNKKGKSMEETIAQYVNFAKLVPGFKSLNPKDVAKLLKAAHFEFWMLGNYMLFNSDYGVSSSWDGSHQSTKKDMVKFFDSEIVDACFDQSDRLKALNLTLEEIALIRLIVLTYTDRCPLLDVTKIQTLQEKFVECLQYQLSKTIAKPEKRMAQIFNCLLSMRDVTHLNVSANQKFLHEWDFLMHDYPLWKEMLSYDGES